MAGQEGDRGRDSSWLAEDTQVDVQDICVSSNPIFRLVGKIYHRALTCLCRGYSHAYHRFGERQMIAFHRTLFIMTLTFVFFHEAVDAGRQQLLSDVIRHSAHVRYLTTISLEELAEIRTGSEI